MPRFLRLEPVTRLAWLLALFLFSGCSGVQTSTPLPTPEAVNVAYTPSLAPLEEPLRGCAAAFPRMALFTQEIPASVLKADKYSLAFQMGEGPAKALFTAPIAWESIDFIVQAGNTVEELSSEALQLLLSGRITQWDKVGGQPQPVQLWTSLPGDEAYSAVIAVILGGAPFPSVAQLAPNPIDMIAAVAGAPGALGYVPHAWLARGGKGIKTLHLDSSLESKLRLPVLALAAREPSGAARSLLLCLQGETGRAVMQGIYQPWK